MSEHGSLLDALYHDAEIRLGREDGDCILSDTMYHESVMALIELAVAAEQYVRYDKQHQRRIATTDLSDALDSLGAEA